MRFNRIRLVLAALVLVCATAPVTGAENDTGTGHDAHGGAGHDSPTGASHASRAGATPKAARGGPAGCVDAALACATSATPAWGPDGSLWLAWVAGGAVSVARSSDLGRTFSSPVVVGRHGASLDTGSDARAQMVVDAQGRVTVAWAYFKDSQWNAQVMTATSAAGGGRFSAPRPLSADPASQRFPVLGTDSRGAIFAAWIDKRLVAAATRRGERRHGGSIAYAWAPAAGEPFQAARLAAQYSCECCRIGVALAAGPAGADELPVLLFRGIFDGRVRDHALVAFETRDMPGPVRRVADDEWVTDSCPHHGPSLTVDAQGAVHAAWFTQGAKRSGVFYARSTDGGRGFTVPMPVGTDPKRASRPALLAAGSTLWLAWKDFDGQLTSVDVMASTDGGQTWSVPRRLAQTMGYSDHPLLVAREGRVHLSWLARAEGYRLLPVDAL